MDAIQMGIARQQIARRHPAHQRFNRGVREVRPQLMDERGGKQGVAVAGQRNDQNLHRRAIFSNSPVVDLPGTNGTSTIRPPADSTARRSF